MTNWLCQFCVKNIMSNFKILSLENKDEWVFLLEKLPISQQDIYYTPEYYSLYENYGDGKAKCFVFEKNEEIALYPFLINSVNSLGYELDKEYYDIQGAYGYNGVISSCYNIDFIDSFYTAFNSYCQESNIIAEFSRFHPLFNNQTFSEKYFDVILDRETVFLDLTKDYEDIWKNEYSGKNRNQIRKANKTGVVSYASPDENEYIEFINLYHETMSNVGATDYYYFDKAYFNNISHVLKDYAHLIVTKVDNEFGGGMILFIYGDYAHYHLSARKREFSKFAVNNHFLDNAIKVAKEQGCKTFHFGGGLSSDINDSLLSFKGYFSKQRSMFYFGKKVHNKKIYNQVVEQWKEKYPDSYEKNSIKLLGYREI